MFDPTIASLPLGGVLVMFFLLLYWRFGFLHYTMSVRVSFLENSKKNR